MKVRVEIEVRTRLAREPEGPWCYVETITRTIDVPAPLTGRQLTRTLFVSYRGGTFRLFTGKPKDPRLFWRFIKEERRGVIYCAAIRNEPFLFEGCV